MRNEDFNWKDNTGVITYSYWIPNRGFNNNKLSKHLDLYGLYVFETYKIMSKSMPFIVH